MFLLIQNNGGLIFGLLNGKKYSIGRTRGNFIIEEPTVSSTHATIAIVNYNIYLVDLSSTNNTYLNGKIITANQQYSLNLGCQIQFGRSSIFILQRDETSVALSSFTDYEERNLFIDLMRKFDYNIAKDWDEDVTHLVVPCYKLTKKFLCAVIKKQHIVTLSYFQVRWSRVLHCKNISKLHEVAYYPTSHEGPLPINDDLDRTKLFNHKVFVFKTRKQFNSFGDVAKLGGGKAYLLEEVQIKKKHIDTKKFDLLLVLEEDISESDNDNDSSEFDNLVEYMESKNRRPISQTEIAMAIMSGSTDKHCNSYFNKKGSLMKQMEPKSIGDVIIMDTEPAVTPASAIVCSAAVVDETEPDSSYKRLHEEDVLEATTKRLKVNDLCNDNVSHPVDTTEIGRGLHPPTIKPYQFEKPQHNSHMSEQMDITNIESNKSGNPVYRKSGGSQAFRKSERFLGQYVKRHEPGSALLTAKDFCSARTNSDNWSTNASPVSAISNEDDRLKDFVLNNGIIELIPTALNTTETVSVAETIPSPKKLSLKAPPTFNITDEQKRIDANSPPETNISKTTSKNDISTVNREENIVEVSPQPSGVTKTELPQAQNLSGLALKSTAQSNGKLSLKLKIEPVDAADEVNQLINVPHREVSKEEPKMNTLFGMPDCQAPGETLNEIMHNTKSKSIVLFEILHHKAPPQTRQSTPLKIKTEESESNIIAPSIASLGRKTPVGKRVTFKFRTDENVSGETSTTAVKENCSKRKNDANSDIQNKKPKQTRLSVISNTSKSQLPIDIRSPQKEQKAGRAKRPDIPARKKVTEEITSGFGDGDQVDPVKSVNITINFAPKSFTRAIQKERETKATAPKIIAQKMLLNYEE